MVRQEVFRGINAICTWYESSSKTTGMWTLGHGNWFVILHNFGYGVIVLATGFLRLGPLSLLLFGASFELAKKKKKKCKASDYRQRSLDNIESASEFLNGEKNTEERAKAQAR